MMITLFALSSCVAVSSTGSHAEHGNSGHEKPVEQDHEEDNY